jgi:hypothetical protein
MEEICLIIYVKGKFYDGEIISGDIRVGRIQK